MIMNKKFLSLYLIVFAVAALVGCTKYDIEEVPYEDGPAMPETLTPPAVSPEWGLELMYVALFNGVEAIRRECARRTHLDAILLEFS